MTIFTDEKIGPADTVNLVEAYDHPELICDQCEQRPPKFLIGWVAVCETCYEDNDWGEFENFNPDDESEPSAANWEDWEELNQ